MRLHIVSALAILGTALVAVPATSAETVINSISVSAKSGGNSASGGQVIEGQSRSEVSVYSEVNGEVVVDKNWIATSSGEPVVVEEKIEVVSTSSQVKVDVKASANVSSDTTETTTLEINTSTIEESETRSIVARLWRRIINIFSYYADWLRK